MHKGLYGQVRKSFITKVYLTLSVQLLITVGLYASSLLFPEYQKFQLDNEWLAWVAMAMAIVVEMAIL